MEPTTSVFFNESFPKRCTRAPIINGGFGTCTQPVGSAYYSECHNGPCLTPSIKKQNACHHPDTGRQAKGYNLFRCNELRCIKSLKYFPEGRNIVQNSGRSPLWTQTGDSAELGF